MIIIRILLHPASHLHCICSATLLWLAPLAWVQLYLNATECWMVLSVDFNFCNELREVMSQVNEFWLPYFQPERWRGGEGREERSKTMRKSTGKWRCWSSNYDGEAILWKYCRPVLSAIILPFVVRNYKLHCNEHIDFFLDSLFITVLLSDSAEWPQM